MTYQIPERQSGRFQATLLDENGVFVPGSSLSTLTLTLYDRATDAIINGRNAQDVLNNNNVSVSEAGVVVWSITPADTPIVGTPVTTTIVTVDGERVVGVEAHVALFRATWEGGAKALTYQMTINVIDYAHLT
jgi:hypothetical protein